MTALSVRNWQQFQHYKDRDPLWIKVYSRLLDDADFLSLPEAAQAQLIKLWLLASRCGNSIRDDSRFLKHALHTKRLYIEELLTAGFLLRITSDAVAQPASTPLAPRYPNASPHARPRARGEEEAEEETELETEQTSSSSARGLFLESIQAEKRGGWVATLAGWEQGQGTPGGKAYGPDQIDAGLAEYLATEAAPNFSPRHVVRFVEQSARAPMGKRAPRRGDSFLDLIPAAEAQA